MTTKTYAQIQQQIEVLQREAERIRREEVDGVIARIKEAIRVYGLTVRDLGLEGNSRHSKSKSLSLAKYRDAFGNEWVGRGPRPIWLREALAAGRRMEDFQVDRQTSQTDDASAGRVHKARRGGRVKYRDKAGNTWSGMGPKPRWLKEAIAAGKSLEDFAS